MLVTHLRTCGVAWCMYCNDWWASDAELMVYVCTYAVDSYMLCWLHTVCAFTCRSILSYLDEVEVSSATSMSRPPAPRTAGGLSPSASTNSAVVDRWVSPPPPTPSHPHPLSLLFCIPPTHTRMYCYMPLFPLFPDVTVKRCRGLTLPLLWPWMSPVPSRH